MQFMRVRSTLLVAIFLVTASMLFNVSSIEAAPGLTAKTNPVAPSSTSQVHQIKTNVYSCKEDKKGCFAVIHITSIHDLKGEHINAPAGAIKASVILPNDPPGSYNPGYVYTKNSVDVYGQFNWLHLYHTELDTEDYYSYSSVSNVWERPYCEPGFDVACGGLLTGHYWDPVRQEGVDWLNASESSQLAYWPYNWQDATYLTTYINIYGGYYCSDRDPSKMVVSC